MDVVIVLIITVCSGFFMIMAIYNLIEAIRETHEELTKRKNKIKWNISWYNDLYNLYFIYYKGEYMSNNTKTICIQNVDVESWKQFRGRALIQGFDSGSDFIRHLINEHAKGNNEK